MSVDASELKKKGSTLFLGALKPSGNGLVIELV